MNYVHKVQYYETDRMGVTHHSNYIRWMEEARIDYLEQIGWPYERLEREGIFSPVVSVSCDYKKTTTFADNISISVSVREFNGIRLIIGYEMKKEGEITVCIGQSEHCFVGKDGFPLRLKRNYPDFYNAINSKIES